MTDPITDSAYVSSDERVLDPTLLEKSAIERMPTPAGWRMLVLPYSGRAKSDGGIHLLKGTVDREALATVVSTSRTLRKSMLTPPLRLARLRQKVATVWSMIRTRT